MKVKRLGIVFFLLSIGGCGGLGSLATECLDGVQYYVKYNTTGNVRGLAPKYSTTGQVLLCE